LSVKVQGILLKNLYFSVSLIKQKMNNKVRFIFTSLTIAIIFFTSCESKKSSKQRTSNTESIGHIISDTNEDLTLLKTRCYACHQADSKSHDEIIAPPLVAVKRRYLRSFPEREAFVNAVVNWTLDPKEENAIMYGAVKKFKVMPYQSFEKSEMTKIAGYLFDNDLEEPAWFDEHEVEMHKGNSKN
jgi:hypothetical protein